MTTLTGKTYVLTRIYACDTSEELRRYWETSIGVTYKNLPEVIAAKDRRKKTLK